MKFIIKRSNWLRGKGSFRSRLLNDYGEMCCLGFLGKACGMSKRTLYGQTCPIMVDEFGVRYPEKIINAKTKSNTKACKRLMVTNDSERIKDSDREKSLKRQFKRIGITVKFID